MESTIPDRYEQNPMLVLVENFILDAIGKLEPEKAAKLNDIICRTFGGTDWRKSLCSQLELPADSAASIQAMWKQRQAEAELKQEDLSPEDFARETADQLFTDMGN